MQDLSDFPEMQQLQFLLDKYAARVKVSSLAEPHCSRGRFPVQLVSLGNPALSNPGIMFVGGIHGVERIGSQVVLSFLSSILQRLSWDKQLQQLLEQFYLAFIPIANPCGMLMQRRANANGVDLMRNSPVEAAGGASFLVGGQRISASLPWYRGKRGQAMESETKAIVTIVQQNLLQRSFSLVLDCHSGFGQNDRLWFPYAHSASQLMPDLASIYRLRELFFSSYPHQNYLFEPQTKHYVCHGDLWDYCYQQSLSYPGVFLPLTLEMGSWRWLKKNPMQMFNSLGLFHPMKPHRVQRVLRRHLVLMEFLMNACFSAPLLSSDEQAEHYQVLAKQLWYR
ncbi:M14 family zinc carboxypeptidase [Agarivorans sp.]|uniref:M14 family zinc carboxypeptidase n=1 Tax=Agarivorans sp. TaxID=1872412 RepID=UPI003CFC3E3C